MQWLLLQHTKCCTGGLRGPSDGLLCCWYQSLVNSVLKLAIAYVAISSWLSGIVCPLLSLYKGCWCASSIIMCSSVFWPGMVTGIVSHSRSCCWNRNTIHIKSVIDAALPNLRRMLASYTKIDCWSDVVLWFTWQNQASEIL